MLSLKRHCSDFSKWKTLDKFELDTTRAENKIIKLVYFSSKCKWKVYLLGREWEKLFKTQQQFISLKSLPTCYPLPLTGEEFLHLFTVLSYNEIMAAVDCQQFKWMGARSAGHTAACNNFIPTAYMHSMTWGDLACYNPDMDRWQPWAARQGSVRRRQRTEPWVAHQEDWPLHHLQ